MKTQDFIKEEIPLDFELLERLKNDILQAFNVFHETGKDFPNLESAKTFGALVTAYSGATNTQLEILKLRATTENPKQTILGSKQKIPGLTV